MTPLKEKESNMATPGPPNTKGIEYERVICTICGGEIPLKKDETMRLHRQRNHHLYGVPNALVPYCPASRSKLYTRPEAASTESGDAC